MERWGYGKSDANWEKNTEMWMDILVWKKDVLERGEDDWEFLLELEEVGSRCRRLVRYYEVERIIKKDLIRQTGNSV